MESDEEKQHLAMNPIENNNISDGAATHSSFRVQIERAAYTQQHLDRVYQRHAYNCDISKRITDTYTSYSKTCTIWTVISTLLGIFPFISQLRHYKLREWLPGDMLSGIVAAVVHIPQSMGFALLTSVKPVYGLYSSFWHVLFYFLFGASPHVSMGTMALISLMIGEIVTGASEKYIHKQNMLNNSLTEDQVFNYNLSVAVSVSLLTGIIQIAMAVLQLGIVTSLMSTSMIVGFTMGAAVHIATSQLKSLFGVVIPGASGIGKAPVIWYQICQHLSEANIATVVTSILCLLTLAVLKEGINEHCKSRMKIQIPAELIVVIVATLVSYLASIDTRYDVKIVGEIGLGFPKPNVPGLGIAYSHFSETFLIAIISFVVTFSMADTFARKHDYSVSTNQEMFAQGICNTLPSFMSSFAGAAAPPRCVLLSTQGSKTQLSGLVTCSVLLLVILCIGPYCKHLPNAALASIIIIALIPMFKQLPQAKQYWKVNKPDFAIWLLTFLCVVFLGIDTGLFIGVGFSVLMLIGNGCFTRGMQMSQAQSSDLYRDNETYAKLISNKSIRVFKWESDLYFAMKQVFKKQLFNVAGQPNELKYTGDDCNGGPTSYDVNKDCYNILLLDCSCMSYIDIVGVNLLNQLHGEYKAAGITMCLTSCPESMISKLYAAGVISDDSTGIACYPTIQDALALM